MSTISLLKNILKRLDALESFRDGFRLYGTPAGQTAEQSAQSASDQTDADLRDKLHARQRQWKDDD